jgi:hypothetical protein
VVMTPVRRGGCCGRLRPGIGIAQQSNECDPDGQADPRKAPHRFLSVHYLLPSRVRDS